jgi:hypothetical protein
MGLRTTSVHQSERKHEKAQQFSARLFKKCVHYPHITTSSSSARQSFSNATAKLTGWLVTAHTSATKLLKQVHKQYILVPWESS